MLPDGADTGAGCAFSPDQSRSPAPSDRAPSLAIPWCWAGSPGAQPPPAPPSPTLWALASLCLGLMGAQLGPAVTPVAPRAPSRAL